MTNYHLDSYLNLGIMFLTQNVEIFMKCKLYLSSEWRVI